MRRLRRRGRSAAHNFLELLPPRLRRESEARELIVCLKANTYGSFQIFCNTSPKRKRGKMAFFLRWTSAAVTNRNGCRIMADLLSPSLGIRGLPPRGRQNEVDSIVPRAEANGPDVGPRSLLACS
jgi:hypothetical protein